jgi:hypothetical protein
LGRRVIENGSLDYLPAATRLPGRCPLPFAGRTPGPSARMFFGPRTPSSEARAPKGRRFAQQRAPPWLQETEGDVQPDPCERLRHRNCWPVGPKGDGEWKQGLSFGGDPITRALPFAGRTPGPSARMSFRPPNGILRSACPEGASVRPAKGTALVARDAHRPTIFPPLPRSAQRASRSLARQSLSR